jgi:superfamily II DNA or RNA helicase
VDNKEHLTISKVNEVYAKIECEKHIAKEVSEYFTFFVPGYTFVPAYRNKIWDGKIRLFDSRNSQIYMGLIGNVEEFCQERDYTFTHNFVDDDYPLYHAKKFIDDLKIHARGEPIEVREHQIEGYIHAMRKRRALLLSPTASGKSLIIYLIFRQLQQYQNLKGLVIVPTTSLVHQMAKDFVDYNRDRPLDIHRITGGVDKSSKSPYTVTTWQSIYKMQKKWFEQFDAIIVDEAHLAKAKSITGIMEKAPDIKYRYGFTGTLDDSQTHKLVLEGIFGQVYQVTQTKKLIEDNTLADFDIKAIVLGYSDSTRKINKNKDYQDEIDWIVRNEARNKFIRNLAWSLKGNTLVLYQFVEKHGKALEPLLQSPDKTIHFIHGGIAAEHRESVRALVESSDNNIILASYGTFSTGVNIKRLDNIIFASPSKSKIRNLQSIGRVLRRGNGKDKATLYDIVDDLQYKTYKNFAIQHFMERVKTYTDEGFEFKIFNVDLKE